MQTEIKSRFSPLHRFLHWGIALCMLFILLTVFLREEWMSKESVGEIIYQNMQSRNISLSEAEAQKIAKSIRKPMFDWHIYVGYALTALYLIRILYISIRGSKFKSPFSKNIMSKQKIQSCLYILFYVVLGVTLFTGILLENAPGDYKQLLKEVHKDTLFFILFFIIIHLIGIFIGEKTTEKGITSSMISGHEK